LLAVKRFDDEFQRRRARTSAHPVPTCALDAGLLLRRGALVDVIPAQQQTPDQRQEEQRLRAAARNGWLAPAHTGWFLSHVDSEEVCKVCGGPRRAPLSQGCHARAASSGTQLAPRDPLLGPSAFRLQLEAVCKACPRIFAKQLRPGPLQMCRRGGCRVPYRWRNLAGPCPMCRKCWRL
jgi:hypothetical protein